MTETSCPADGAAESDVEILGRETVFRGFFAIERLRLRHRVPGGEWSVPYDREVFERGHAVAILPYDPDLDRVVLIEQLRVPALLAGAAAWQIEVPAGIIEADEQPEAVAARELAEETGLSALELRPLFRFLPSAGGSSETIVLYLARVDSRDAGGRHGLAEEQEDIRVLAMSAQEAFHLAASGRIENAAALLALQWLQLHHDDLAGPPALPAAARPR